MNAPLPPPVQAPKPNDPVPTEKPKTAAPSPQRHKMRGALRWMGGISLSVILVAAVLWFAVLPPPLVEVVTVRRGNLTAEIEGTGTVTADSLANVASKITGRVEQVFVDQGDAVTRGQIIATLDETALRRDVDAARARLAAASDSSSERRREWEREKTLTRSGAVSTEDSQQYRERASVAQSTALAATADVARAEYELSLAQIPALVSGIVINRWVVPGASVVAGRQMFSIADKSLIHVSAYIDQSDGGKRRRSSFVAGRTIPYRAIFCGSVRRQMPGRRK